MLPKDIVDCCMFTPGLWFAKDLSLLGWQTGTVAAARDLWARADFPASKDRFPASGTLQVEPHATLLRLSQVF